jgi:hypothetical protein
LINASKNPNYKYKEDKELALYKVACAKYFKAIFILLKGLAKLNAINKNKETLL